MFRRHAHYLRVNRYIVRFERFETSSQTHLRISSVPSRNIQNHLSKARNACWTIEILGWRGDFSAGTSPWESGLSLFFPKCLNHRQLFGFHRKLISSQILHVMLALCALDDELRILSIHYLWWWYFLFL